MQKVADFYILAMKNSNMELAKQFLVLFTITPEKIKCLRMQIIYTEKKNC